MRKWILLAVAALTLWFLRDAVVVLLALLLFAGVLAYAASPLARFFEERLSKRWGALLAFLIFAAVVVGVALLFVPMMLRQAVAAGEAFPGMWERLVYYAGELQENLRAIGLPEEWMDSLGEQVGHVGETVANSLREKAMGIAQWVLSIGWVALAPIVSYYFLRDRAKFFSLLERLIPSQIRPVFVAISAGSREAIGQYVRGQVMVSICTGAMTAVGLLIVGLPSWLLMGFCMMVFNLIPYFGPILGMIPIALLAAVDGWGMVLQCAVVVVAAQQIESLFVTPLILSDSVDLHPVVVIVALLIGGYIGGLAGMVFIIPFVLIVRVVTGELYEYYLVERARSGISYDGGE